MTCIICDADLINSSIEHIVPESLGNVSYVLAANIICNICNHNFSKWEEKALTKSYLAFIRIKNGIKTKKGKPSTLQIGNIKARGSNEFEKDIIKLKGFEEKDISSTGPQNGSFQITMPDFDKSDMAASRMLLKIGYEAIYKSQNKLFQRLDFTQLKTHLTKKDNRDWPFLTSHNQYYTFKSIPTFFDKYKLNSIKCRLTYAEISESILLFDFKYDFWNLTINLLNRDYSWVKPYLENDTSASLYPVHLKESKLYDIQTSKSK